MIFGKGVLTDKLHDFSQFIFLLEDLLKGFTEDHEFGLSLSVVFTEDSIVVGEGNVPVHGGEMLSLSELLIQAPEDLHDGKSGRGNGIGEITTGWGHGTDNRDGTLTVGGTQAGNTASTLVELSELGTQVSWETSIGGHLSETT